MNNTSMLLLVVILAVSHELEQAEAFLAPSLSNVRPSATITTRPQTSRYMSSSFYEDFEDFNSNNNDDNNDDEDDDDDTIDPDSLGDWRNFRRNLAQSTPPVSEDIDDKASGKADELKEATATTSRTSVSKENEEILSNQSKDLAEEYKAGVWAHEVSTPEVGGLIVRMPIEVELYRNHRHSIVGRKLKKKYGDMVDEDDATTWYKKARSLVEDEMQEIASTADDSGQIDSTTLSDESTEMLQIFLDNQETWQEVSLVVEKDDADGTAKALVLNRPMAFKLTENLSRLVLHGAYLTSPTLSSTTSSSSTAIPPISIVTEPEQRGNVGAKKDLVKFMLAFGQECAVYVGGADDQDKPATILHGIRDLAGAREISPGTGLYEGGLEAAVDGVLHGKYKPLDFRFFVGCHISEESTLDVSVVLGKYQPVACARSLALKQCISLPKPLWHEVLELCGGSMAEVSALEMLKRDDILFQVIDEDDDDMFDELKMDDDDDDFYDE